MRICLIATLALLVAACSGKSEPTATTHKTVAPTLALSGSGDDAVAAVLESQGKPLAQLGFVIDSRPVVGRAFRLQLLVSATTALPAIQLTTESDVLHIDPPGAALTLSESGSGGVRTYSAQHDFTLTAAQPGLTELTVHLTADADSPETVYAIPVVVGAAGAANAPASGKADPPAAADHAQPKKG